MHFSGRLAFSREGKHANVTAIGVATRGQSQAVLQKRGIANGIALLCIEDVHHAHHLEVAVVCLATLLVHGHIGPAHEGEAQNLVVGLAAHRRKNANRGVSTVLAKSVSAKVHSVCGVFCEAIDCRS